MTPSRGAFGIDLPVTAGAHLVHTGHSPHCRIRLRREVLRDR
jgi:hypothetical protein